MTKKQHYMTEHERYKLESYLEAGRSVSWIARKLGFCRQTIYNEMKRGTYLHTVRWWDKVVCRTETNLDQMCIRVTNKLSGIGGPCDKHFVAV